jgi:hypothetical protein
MSRGLIQCLIKTKSTPGGSQSLPSAVRALWTGTRLEGYAREPGVGLPKIGEKESEDLESPSTKKGWQMVQKKGKSSIEMTIRQINEDETLFSDSRQAKSMAMKKMKALQDSLMARGHAREMEPYDPPKDVEKRLDMIFKQVFGDHKSSTSMGDTSLKDPVYKFKFLTECAKEFRHEVPNPSLYGMTTVGDVIQFYKTRVQGLVNYDQMVRDHEKLPTNLHVISEPIRFNPEHNELFKGEDAFPGSTQYVRGLRAQKKYPVIKKRFNWPDI